MSENPRRGRQARNFGTNVSKILALKSSSEHIFFRKLSLGAPEEGDFSSLVPTAEVKYSSRKIALKATRDGEKNMTHGSVNIFFKLLLKNVL